MRPYTPGKALHRHSPLNSAVQASCHSLYDSPATLRLPSRQAAAACHTSNMQLPLVALPSRQLHWTTSEATSTLSSRHGRAQMAGGSAVQLAAGRPAVAAHSLTHGTSHLALSVTASKQVYHAGEDPKHPEVSTATATLLRLNRLSNQQSPLAHSSCMPAPLAQRSALFLQPAGHRSQSRTCALWLLAGRQDVAAHGLPERYDGLSRCHAARFTHCSEMCIPAGRCG